MKKPLPFPKYTDAHINTKADELRETYAAGELPVEMLLLIDLTWEWS